MLKNKKIGAIVLATAMTLSLLPGGIVKATNNKLNLEEIKKVADRIMQEKHKERAVNFNSDKNLYESVEGKQYKAEDRVRIIVELEESKQQGKAAITDNKNIQEKVLKHIKGSNANFDLRHSFSQKVNSLSGEAKVSDIEILEDLPNVKKVRIAKTYTANLGGATEMVQSSQVWEELGYKGEGMVIGVLDTGFQLDHRDFKLGEEGKEEAKLTENNLQDKLSSTNVDDIYYNEKIPTGYDWADMDNNVLPKDLVNGAHGMHVAGIVAANGDVENGGVKGIAPEAQIIAEKVFTDWGGAYEDDIAKGILHATEMGADVINMSLGSDAGSILQDDLVQEAIEKVTKEGVLLVVAAGNAYYNLNSGHPLMSKPYKDLYDIGTLGDPAVSPYALAVASVENNYTTTSLIELSNGEKFNYVDQQSYVSNLVNELGINSEFEFAYAGKGSSEDFRNTDCNEKIVIVNPDQIYGSYGVMQKEAENKGAKALVVVANYENNLNATRYSIPLISTGKAEGEALIELIKSGQTISGTVTGKKNVMPLSDKLKVNEFSSWGTAPTLEFKPEISGVGGSIYSTTPDGGYTTMSGTSMATPQVAGAAAILMQAMKEKGAEQSFDTVMKAKNILMNNTTIIDKEDKNVPHSTREQGAGLLQLADAIKTPLIAYDKNASMERRGAIELKEFEEKAEFTVSLESVIDESNEYEVFVDLYTDTLVEKEIDNNWDGQVDLVTEVNELYNREINGAKVTINGEEINKANGYNVEINKDNIENLNINIDLSNSDMEEEVFLEGYIRIVSKNDEYKEVSLPLMGFHGEWDEGPNIDAPLATESDEAFFSYTAVFAPEEDMPLGFDPLTNSFNLDAIAISPYSYVNMAGPSLSVLRNLDYLDISVEDEEGNMVKQLDKYEDLSKNTYYNNNFSYKFSDIDPWDGTNENGEFVKDGRYKFVAKSKLAYEGAEEQEVELPIAVDSETPTVTDLKVAPDGNEFKISFNVEDNLTGYWGTVLYIDNEYVPLEPGMTEHFVDKMPEQVVAIVYDNARNCRLEVWGNENDIPQDVLIPMYNVYGNDINFEDSIYIQGIAQKVVKWNIEILDSKGAVVDRIKDLEDIQIYIPWSPEQGLADGVYKVKSYAEDMDGFRLDLPEKEFNIVNNEIKPVEGKPGKVQNLKGTSLSNSSIKINWEAPQTEVTVKEYIVYKDGVEVTRVSGEINEYTLEELNKNTLYGIKVVAVSYDNQKSRPVAINCRTIK
ncbi:S8 family serine peptidase [Clostridium tarantellae]|uniref:S8 family serine peptidase n=1 Tax=Clostridium tarantellae TaxID=39493 RepID=A0A6I1MR81_9CLOT|nr:S8 family serine peptidase [Clostridium tarantellae]MPQ44722.1 S8 family serine peptidase [Clostridium tarantellae]